MDKWHWSKKEIEFLKNNYEKISVEKISKKLNRSVGTIRVVAWKMGFIKSFINKCKYCGAEFTTKVKNKKYCCAECRHEMGKVNQRKSYRKRREETYKERAEKILKIKERKEKLKASNEAKSILTIFFESECLNVDAYEGIERMKKFTQKQDAEKIYRLLRNDFIKSRSF